MAAAPALAQIAPGARSSAAARRPSRRRPPTASAAPRRAGPGRSRLCPTSRSRPGCAAAAAAAARDVGPRPARRTCSHYIQQIGVEGLNPADYDAAGLEAAIADRQSVAAVGRCDPALQPGLVGPRAGPCEEGRRGSTGSWSTTTSCREAGRVAARRARAARHRRRAERPASDASAICRAQGRARGDARRATRPSATASGSTWTAGAGCRATSATKYIIVNVPGFHATLVENGVNRWKQRAIAGKLSTPTPQLIGDGDGRDPQSVVGSARRASRHEAAGKKGFVPVKVHDGKLSAGASRPGRPTRLAS